jgi:diacylglycerol kinase family enzyme
MPAPIEVIINAESGANDKEEVRQRLLEIFNASGVEARITLARSGAEIVELAQRAAKGPAQTLVAGGGDGTVNAVASALVCTGKSLGILPLGTLNHFAKDLRIPLDLEGAARTIIAGRTINVDTGDVNGRIFLNNSSLGLYPVIVRHRERQQRLGYGKWPAFLWAAFEVLRRYPFLSVRLSVDGSEFATRTPFVFIGNNEYEMERFNIGRRTRLDAGVLSVYVTHGTGRLGLLRLAFRALIGRLRSTRDFTSLLTKEAWVETRRPRELVSTDGEVVVMDMPLYYHVRHLALRVIVPQESNGWSR